MLFEEIVSAVMDRMNLTSDDARERVGKAVNRTYKKATANVGLITSRRVNDVLVLDGETPVPDDIAGNTLPEITANDIEKITRVVYLYPDSDRFRVLEQMQYEDLRDLLPRTGIPTSFAIKKMGPGIVEFRIDAFPEEEFSLGISGYDHATELEEGLEPYMPTDYHDVLIEGAMSEELRKMEKPQLAAIAETAYQQRLSDLRFFITKTAYLEMYQSKTSFMNNQNWNRSRNYYWVS